MIKSFSVNSNLNKFFQKVTLKKQQIKILKKKVLFLNTVKKLSYKNLLLRSFFQYNVKKDFRWRASVMYIVEILFSRTNTLLHIMDSSGNLKFFCSAGNLLFKGKWKKSWFLVFKAIKAVLDKKLKFLHNKPIALHLKNVKSMKRWIIRELKKKMFILVINNFTLYPYNGCRKKK